MALSSRSLFLLALLPFLPYAGGSAPARAQAVDAGDESVSPEVQKERETLVRTLTNVTLSVLQDQKKDYADRAATMAGGITRMVDIDWIAQFVLGPSWRTATPGQRERYTGLYRKYLTKMYISNFAQNRERKIRDIKVLGIADSQKTSFVARTEIFLSTGENLHVDYRVHEKENTRQIVDIIIEGVSLLASHRAEFSKLAQARGVEGVIAALEKLDRADTPALTFSMN